MNGLINATVTTTGSAGSASGTASVSLVGYLNAIKIDWHASAPATSDITIIEVGGLARTIYTKSNSVTDVTFYPALQQGDNTGTAITGAYGRVYIPYVALTISIVQCDALAAACVVSFLMTDQ